MTKHQNINKQIAYFISRYLIVLMQAFEIFLLQELKHFLIDHTGGLMLEMLSMHTFKHMRSQSQWKLLLRREGFTLFRDTEDFAQALP